MTSSIEPSLPNQKPTTPITTQEPSTTNPLESGDVSDIKCPSHDNVVVHSAWKRFKRNNAGDMSGLTKLIDFSGICLHTVIQAASWLPVAIGKLGTGFVKLFKKPAPKKLKDEQIWARQFIKDHGIGNTINDAHKLFELKIIPEQFKYYDALEQELVEIIPNEANRPSFRVTIRKEGVSDDDITKSNRHVSGYGPLSGSAQGANCINNLKSEDWNDSEIILFSGPAPYRGVKNLLNIGYLEPWWHNLETFLNEAEKDNLNPNINVSVTLGSNTLHRHLAKDRTFLDLTALTLGPYAYLVDHIPELTAEGLKAMEGVGQVGYVGTLEGEKFGVYRNALKKAGFKNKDIVTIDPKKQKWVQQFINKAKSGKIKDRDFNEFQEIIKAMREANPALTHIIWGCTEIPLALETVVKLKGESYTTQLLGGVTPIDSEQVFGRVMSNHLSGKATNPMVDVLGDGRVATAEENKTLQLRLAERKIIGNQKVLNNPKATEKQKIQARKNLKTIMENVNDDQCPELTSKWIGRMKGMEVASLHEKLRGSKLNKRGKERTAMEITKAFEAFQHGDKYLEMKAMREYLMIPTKGHIPPLMRLVTKDVDAIYAQRIIETINKNAMNAWMNADTKPLVEKESGKVFFFDLDDTLKASIGNRGIKIKGPYPGIKMLIQRIMAKEPGNKIVGLTARSEAIEGGAYARYDEVLDPENTGIKYHMCFGGKGAFNQAVVHAIVRGFSQKTPLIPGEKQLVEWRERKLEKRMIRNFFRDKLQNMNFYMLLNPELQAEFWGDTGEGDPIVQLIKNFGLDMDEFKNVFSKEIADGIYKGLLGELDKLVTEIINDQRIPEEYRGNWEEVKERFNTQRGQSIEELPFNPPGRPLNNAFAQAIIRPYKKSIAGSTEWQEKLANIGGIKVIHNTADQARIYLEQGAFDVEDAKTVLKEITKWQAADRVAHRKYQPKEGERTKKRIKFFHKPHSTARLYRLRLNESVEELQELINEKKEENK